MTIPGIDKLVIKQKLYTQDFAKMLVSLLPRGYIWNIPLPREDAIKLIGIPSTESIGLLTIPGFNGSILPSGIPSSEEVPEPAIIVDQFISGTGIPSAEGIGLVTIPSIIYPTGILSQGQMGYPTMKPGYLAGSDFEDGLGPGIWDTDFTDNWFQTTEDGEDIAQTDGDSTNRLFPSSPDYLTGDFRIEVGFWASTDQGSANKSVHLEFNDSGGFRFKTQYLGNASPQRLDGINGGQIPNLVGPLEMKVIVERVNGIIWCYYWNGSIWLREDSWPVAGSSRSIAADLYLNVNGATNVNGFTYLYVYGTIA